MYLISYSSLVAFQIFSLSLNFVNFTVTYLSVNFFEFILLGVHRDFWICRFTSLVKFEVLVIINSNLLFTLSFSFLSGTAIMCISMLDGFTQVSEAPLRFPHFFLLSLSEWIISIAVFWSSLIVSFDSSVMLLSITILHFSCYIFLKSKFLFDIFYNLYHFIDISYDKNWGYTLLPKIWYLLVLWTYLW